MGSNTSKRIEELKTLFLEKPEALLDVRFQESYRIVPQEWMRDLIKDKGVSHPSLGFSNFIIPFYEEHDIEDWIGYLTESELYEGSRSAYVLTQFSQSKKISQLVEIINNLPEEHSLIEYLNDSNQPYFSTKDYFIFIKECNSILNGDFSKTNKDNFPWTENDIIKTISYIRYDSIPLKLRTNRVLSYIVFGCENSEIKNMSLLFTPQTDDDFPMPDFFETNSEDNQWIDTIKYWLNKQSVLPIDADLNQVFDVFKSNPLGFINRLNSDHQFAKKHYSIALGYQIIRHDPALAVMLPKRFITIKQYALIIKKNPKLISHIPLLLRGLPGFWALTK